MLSTTMFSLSSHKLALTLFLLLNLCAVNAAEPPCNICGDGGTVGDLSAIYNGETCQHWKGLGDAGNFTAAECQTIQQSALRQTCNCQTNAPTAAPTPTPQPTGRTTIVGEVVLVVLNVTNVMSLNVQADFEMVMADFFQTWFLQVATERDAWSGKLHNWDVAVEEQLKLIEGEGTDQEGGRHLRQSHFRKPQEEKQDINKNYHRRLVRQGFEFPLQIGMTVTAEATQTRGRASFEQSLKDTIEQKEAELLLLLLDTDSLVTKVYFTPVGTTQTFLPDETVTTVKAVRPTDTGSSDSGDGGDDGLDTRAIAGIAGAAGFVLILFAGIICVICRPDHHSKEQQEKQLALTSSSRAFGDSLKPGRRPSHTPEDAASLRSSVVSSTRYRSSRLGQAVSSSTRIVSSDGRTLSVLQHTSPDSEEFGKEDPYPESAPPREGDPDYYQRGGQPVFQDEGAPHDEGFDDEQGHYQDEYHDDDGGYQDYAEEGDEEHEHMEGSYHDQQSYNDQQSYHDQPAQGEYADGSYQPESVENSTIPTVEGHPNGAEPAMITREVTAPPGKLGIVIETTLEGPVVHKINDNSPLLGIVFEGDLITGIDDVDTRAMSASAITALMVRTADNPRRMIIKSEAQ